MGKFMEIAKDKIRSWLEIKDGNPRMYVIHQNEDFETYCIKNKIWYRGESAELCELYKQIVGKETTFWGSVPSSGMEIKKAHSGLPKLIVHTLSNIVIDDYDGLDFNNDTVSEEEWETISKDNNFEKQLKTIINETIAIGDGAIRVSFDKKISKLPILEWFSGDEVEFKYCRGRLTDIIFKSYHQKGRETYLLKECRGYGYIKYKLFNERKEEVPLSTIDDLKELKDLSFDNSVMWAVPLMFDNSIKYDGRGSSKFDGKLDSFDSLDEIISQWVEAIRLGRTKTYIPEALIPKDPNTGESLTPNPYDNQFIAMESDMAEGANNKVQVEQSDIPSDKYLQTYMTYLDLCLQGLISPSTLGIDTKKVQDANAQYERQMEKTTMYTRQGIVEALSEFIPKVINMVFKAKEQILGNVPPEDIDVSVKFGEYATPSFDAQIDTVSKAKAGGIMSLETVIDELYGDSKDDEWKQEELARLKEEQGIMEMLEPAVNNDLNLMGGENNELQEKGQKEKVGE